MKPGTLVALVVLVAFTAFSVYPLWTEGYLAFLRILDVGPWGAQVLIDLVIACGLFTTWMVRDARERGLVAWPFVILVLTVGSIGALSYLVYRGLKSADAARSPAAAVR